MKLYLKNQGLQLIDEMRKGASVSYVYAQLTNIFGGTPFEYFLKILKLDYLKEQDVLKYLYNIYLSLDGY